MSDPASLNNLHDILIPPPVPWWPPAPGWYALIAVIFIVSAALFRIIYRKWRANAYRRAALSEYRQLSQRVKDNTTRIEALREVPVLLKRAALAVGLREKIAALTGVEWLAFLDHTGRTRTFSEGDGRLLIDLGYSGTHVLNAISEEQIEYLMRMTERWIKKHRLRL